MLRALLIPLLIVPLLSSCFLLPKPKEVPVAAPQPTIQPPPPEVVKSVSTRQDITPRFENSAKDLTDSYKSLGGSLEKAQRPK